MARDSRPWIKVSVDMWRHPKITALSMPQRWALIGLWSISMEFHTDGVLTVQMARDLGIDLRLIKALSKTGSVTLSSDGLTIHLHDYLEHQMSAEKIESLTNQRRSAGEKGGKAKAAKRSGPLPAERSGPLEPKPSGSLSGGKPYARRAAEEEEERELNSPRAAALRKQTREREQQPRDDIPLPPEPPADDDPPPSHGNLALVPTAIDATTPRHRTHISDAARTLVRTFTPAGIPRSVRERLAEQVQRLANDRHVDRADIEAGLAEWSRRPGAGPRLLPDLVADAARNRTTPTTGTATAKAQGWLNLINHLPPDDTPKELT